MTLAIHAAWDFARIGSFSAVASGAGTITISTGIYSNVTWASIVESTGYDANGITDFATALKTALDAGGGGPWTVTFSATTQCYTVSRASAFTFTSMNTVAQHILGEGDASTTLGTSYTFPKRAYYSILSAAGARSNPRKNERDGCAGDGAADDGTPGGWAQTTFPKYLSWEQQAETLAATWIEDAAAGVPWTYEHLYQHCRTVNPFLVVDTKTYAHMLLGNAAHFDPSPLFSNYDGQWSIPFKTRILGHT